jgi:hypothetical protein
MRGNDAWFDRLRRGLARCEGVRSVAVNPGTASVLILHTSSLDRIAAWANDHGFFALQADTQTAEPASAHFAGRLAAADTRVHEMSGGLVDGRSLVFVGLLVAAAWQLLRGNVWPAAGSLAWYAFNSLPAFRPAPQARQRATRASG